ncbi:MAG: hypothetical protein JSW26_10585 [Desulfobacterales bacterium]|nr:MAG: hypothetical protein JSW26_10585 [Desulfobacterales bacterium]
MQTQERTQTGVITETIRGLVERVTYHNPDNGWSGRQESGYRCRIETYQRTFGDLFYFCCDEVSDISFIEALYRILTLAADQLRHLGDFCEKTASAFFDAIMNTALQCVGLSKNNLANNPES